MHSVARFSAAVQRPAFLNRPQRFSSTFKPNKAAHSHDPPINNEASQWKGISKDNVQKAHHPSTIKEAPGWDEHLASRSEAIVKAEHSDTSNLKQLQDDTVKLIQELDEEALANAEPEQQKPMKKKKSPSTKTSAENSSSSQAKMDNGDAYDKMFRSGESTMPSANADRSKLDNAQGTRRYYHPNGDEGPRPDIASSEEFQYRKQQK